MLTLTRRRAAQFRSRRPGRMIATAPTDTIPVEKTLIREGRPTGALVLLIDEVLRRTTATLTNAKQPVPVLVGVDAHPDHLTARFAGPTDLPPVVGPASTATPARSGGSPPTPTSTRPGRSSKTVRRPGRNWSPSAATPPAGGWSTSKPSESPPSPATRCTATTWPATSPPNSPSHRGHATSSIDCLGICAELPGLAPDRIHFHTEPAVIANRVRDAVATADRLTTLEASTPRNGHG